MYKKTTTTTKKTPQKTKSYIYSDRRIERKLSELSRVGWKEVKWDEGKLREKKGSWVGWREVEWNEEKLSRWREIERVKSSGIKGS